MASTHRICSIPDCERKIFGRGWCQTHYMRWWGTGDVKADVPIQPRTLTPLQRFRQKVNQDGPGCHLWTAHIDSNGYGVFRAKGKLHKAHRFLFEALNGPLPEGVVLDHLCRIRHCVNPQHLEAVVERVNIMRGVGAPALNARKTHCKRGHPLSGENLGRRSDGGRWCKKCSSDANAEWRKRHTRNAS